MLLCWDTAWIMSIPTQIYPEHPSLRQGYSVTAPYDVSQIQWHVFGIHAHVYRADCEPEVCKLLQHITSSVSSYFFLKTAVKTNN